MITSKIISAKEKVQKILPRNIWNVVQNTKTRWSPTTNILMTSCWPLLKLSILTESRRTMMGGWMQEVMEEEMEQEVIQNKINKALDLN